MTQLEFIKRIAESLDETPGAVARCLDEAFNQIMEAVTKGERLTIRGFGCFYKKPIKRRIVRNPRTGEKLVSKNTERIKFKPGLAFIQAFHANKKLE